MGGAASGGGEATGAACCFWAAGAATGALVGATRVGTITGLLVRANGQPLYTLTNPTDDAMMGITHVLRGEDLLSSTPRQIALYEAFAEIGIGADSRARGDRPRRRHWGGSQRSRRRVLLRRLLGQNILFRDLTARA